MNAQAIAQVANFLSVSPNQIKRCEEWASVLFVIVHGRKPRFVSKKVLAVSNPKLVKWTVGGKSIEAKLVTAESKTGRSYKDLIGRYEIFVDGSFKERSTAERFLSGIEAAKGQVEFEIVY